MSCPLFRYLPLHPAAVLIATSSDHRPRFSPRLVLRCGFGMWRWAATLGPWLLIVAISGCVPASATRSVAILDGAVQLVPPQGYCIDRSASRESKDHAVILMGRCSSASLRNAAVISVTVGPSGSASVLRGGGAELSRLFRSNRGRALLSRSGRAQDLQLLSLSQLEEIFLLRLRDRRVGDYWRAITGAHGRLIAVSATGAPGLTLSPQVGKALVTQTAAHQDGFTLPVRCGMSVNHKL
jgi:hypothetical protein